MAVNYANFLGDRGRDYLVRMQDSAGRMQTLIKDLLTLSRVATHGQPFGSVDLNVLLPEILSDLETAIEEKQAEITVKPLPTIQADATQMRQLFQNLLSNALKFHEPGKAPIISVYCNCHSEGEVDGDWQEIVVQDNGIGFEQKYTERIFGVFQRLHGRSEYEGSGIGLAICHRIVQRHNGRITATSSLGNGATFTIYLPAT